MTRLLLKTALIASTATLLIAAGPKADLNQDGQVTKAEFTQSAQSRFIAADTNGDNLLSEDERTALREAKRTERQDKRFEKLDTNGDSVVSREEMDARSAEMKAKKDARKDERKQKILEKFDTNLDGELSDAERTIMRTEKKEQRAAKKAERKEMRAEGKKGKRGKRINPDVNEDGFISLDEHMAMADKLFARMDANEDGVLTKGEGRKRKGKRGFGRGK